MKIKILLQSVFIFTFVICFRQQITPCLNIIIRILNSLINNETLNIFMRSLNYKTFLCLKFRTGIYFGVYY